MFCQYTRYTRILTPLHPLFFWVHVSSSEWSRLPILSVSSRLLLSLLSNIRRMVGAGCTCLSTPLLVVLLVVELVVVLLVVVGVLVVVVGAIVTVVSVVVVTGPSVPSTSRNVSGSLGLSSTRASLSEPELWVLAVFSNRHRQREIDRKRERENGERERERKREGGWRWSVCFGDFGNTQWSRTDYTAALPRKINP